MVHPYLRRRDGRGAGRRIPTTRFARCWTRRWACRCFRSRRCGWRWWRPASRRARPTSCAARWAAWRRPGVIEQFRQKLIDGMLANGLSAEFAERVFRADPRLRRVRLSRVARGQLRAAGLRLGVAEALLSGRVRRGAASTASRWAFTPRPNWCATPASTASRCAPVDVNASDWDCTLEAGRAAAGLAHGPRACRKSHARAIEQARAAGPFRGWDDFCRRTRLSRAVVARLAAADAFSSLALDRRGALWQALAEEKQPRRCRCSSSCDPTTNRRPPLPRLETAEEVVADYRTAGLSLRAHPHAVPARAAGRAGHRAGRAAGHASGRSPRARGRHRAGAAAAQHGQGHHVRHAGRRDRHGEPDRPARTCGSDSTAWPARPRP